MKLLRVRDVMNADVDTVRGPQRVSEFLTDVMNHGSVPVVDENAHLVGMLRRSDLLAARPEATADELAQREFPVVYSDEIVHDVALRFVQEELGRCPVVSRETGGLAGILTAFDLLKAKDWEHLQEMSEPARLWGRRPAETG